MLLNIFWATAQTGWHGSVSSTDQAKIAKYNAFCCYGWISYCYKKSLVGVFGLEQKVYVYGLNLSSFVSRFVLTRVLFANNEILSAVSTEFERKEYLAKIDYCPNTWRGATRGAWPPEARGHQRRVATRGAWPPEARGHPEARGPMQPHRLPRLKTGPALKYKYRRKR